jgi:DNA-binding MarR family transcriptional regulator
MTTQRGKERIPIQTLVDLVLKEKKTASEIARMYGLRPSSVAQRLKRLELDRRTLTHEAEAIRKRLAARTGYNDFMLQHNLLDKFSKLVASAISAFDGDIEKHQRNLDALQKLADALGTPGQLHLKSEEERAKIRKLLIDTITAFPRGVPESRHELLLKTISACGPAVKYFETYLTYLTRADTMSTILEMVGEQMENVDPGAKAKFFGRLMAYLRVATNNPPPNLQNSMHSEGDYLNRVGGAARVKDPSMQTPPR